MKKTFKFKATMAVVMAAVASSASAGLLEQELKFVLDNHPGIKASTIALGASGDRVQAAMAAYFPKLNLYGDTGREDLLTRTFIPDNTTTPPSIRNASQQNANPTDSKLDRKKSMLTLEQNLFNGGRRAASVEIAETDKQIQRYNLEAQTQDVMLEAITAYVQVARYKTLIKLAQLNEEITKQQLALETKRVEGGGGIAIDVLQARTRLQIVRERRVFYEQGLRDASATYLQVFGHAPDLDLIQDVHSYQEKLPANMIAATNYGIENNPRLAASRLQIQRARLMLELERSAFAPTIDLVGTRNIERNVGQMASKDETSILLKMNWTLFSGLDTTHRTAAASKDQQEAESRDLVAQNKTLEAIRIQWNELMNGRERLELLESAAGISRDVMENRKRLRDAGKETALNVLDAEMEYFGVLANMVNARFDIRIGSYKLLSAMGSLSVENIGLGDKFKLPVKPLVLDLQAISTAASDK